MKNLQEPYPFSYRMMNAIGRLLVAAKAPIIRLDEETVCTKAMKMTGLTDFGHPHYREGLLHFLESANEDANLHPLGRFFAHRTVVGYLSQRLLMVEARKKETEIYQQPLLSPLIIIGMARSGTTLLHRMLAHDPAHCGIPVWLLCSPFPIGPENKDGKDPRFVDMEQGLRFRKPLLPDIDTIHYVRADSPEECILTLGLTFNSLIFGTLYPVSGYSDWYLQQNNSQQKYREYRQLLQVFQSHDPERRLTLKAPAHTGNLAAILEAIPNALIIQTHRHPPTCVISSNSLLRAHHLGVTNRLDVRRTADRVLEFYEVWLKHNVAFRTANPGMVYDVFYDDLVSDPIGTVQGIYTHFNLSWTDSHATELQTYIQQNRKDKYGKHSYAASDFGTTEAEIADRLQFYSKHIGF
jgi:hypothetical protein